jgi:chromate reductase
MQGNNMTKKVAVIVGSVRKDSINLKLSKALAHVAPRSLELVWTPIDQLPIYNQDLDKELPAAAKQFKERIAVYDGVLFVTPEHNRSIPAALKNALDWGSRPYGQSVWAGKRAAIAGASIGAIGTAVAQSHLRGTLAYLNMPTLGQPELYLHFTPDLIDSEGIITKEDTQGFLRGFMDKFSAWVFAS